MEVKAIGKNIAVSRIKARIPADIVRNMSAVEAVATLEYIQKGTALPVKKLIESAIANAKNNYNLDPESLYVQEIRVDKGPQTKMNTRRMMPAAKGRAKFFDRKYCHITVVLSDRQADATKPKAKKAEKVEVAAQHSGVAAEAKSATKSAKKPSTKAKKSVKKAD